MSAQPVDVPAVMAATSAGLWSVANNCSRSDLMTAMRARAEEFDRASAAVAALCERERVMREALGKIAGNTIASACAAMEMRQDALAALVSVGGAS